MRHALRTALIVSTFILALTGSFAQNTSVGLAWDEADRAEGYKVYWKEFRGNYDITPEGQVITLPVCGGYLDPGDLIEQETCVDRALPAIAIHGLPDDVPEKELWMAVKAVNEAGESWEFSNDVAKHLAEPGNVGGAKRAMIVISWVEGEEPEIITTQLMGLRIEPAP